MEDVNSLSGTSFLSGDFRSEVALYSKSLQSWFTGLRFDVATPAFDVTACRFPFNCWLIMNTPKKEIHLLLRLQENLLF